MSCYKVILAENQKYHRKHVHKGEKVRFRIHNDAKQPKLQFGALHRKVPENERLSSSNNSSKVVEDQNSDIDDPDSSDHSEDDDSELNEHVARNEQLSGPGPSDHNVTESMELATENVSVLAPPLTPPPPSPPTEIPVPETRPQLSPYQNLTPRDDVLDGPNQPELEAFDPKMYDGFKRDFNCKWYKKFPWISYNVERRQVSCFACQKFMQDDDFKYDNWRKTVRLLNASMWTKLLQMIWRQ